MKILKKILSFIFKVFAAVATIIGVVYSVFFLYSVRDSIKKDHDKHEDDPYSI